jgi:hypothetical protein
LGRAPWIGMTITVFMMLGVCPGSQADVGVVLNDSLDTSLARITGSGHSAVYFSRICPNSPVKMRLCRSDENGSVVSNYTTLGEDQPFEWNIVPLNTYLYGVSNPKDRPLFASTQIKGALEEQYRENVLRDLCASQSCRTSGKAEWREMVGAESERTIYILVVSTTVQQDLAMIAKFNAARNVNHFNGVVRNCADFTKDVIDTYFPHAAHRDVINDFGITSPKGVARTFAQYARHHDESDYHVIHFAQLPGTIKHSSECRSGTEQLYRSKKLLIPMAFLAWHALPVVAGSYLLTGRFNPQREFELHATAEETEIGEEIKDETSGDDPESRADLVEAEKQERANVLGDSSEWAAFREKFGSVVEESVRERSIPGRDSLDHVFKKLGENGKPFVDERGHLWMEVRDRNGVVNVGLSPSNLLAQGSDQALAYQVILAHVNDVLKSSPRRRETIAEFKEVWGLLQEARSRNQIALAGKPPQGQSSNFSPTQQIDVCVNVLFACQPAWVQ